MTIATAIGLLTALFKAIPVLKEWFDDLITAYVNHSIDTMRKENREALGKALNGRDQRDLEKAIGSPTAGKPSGDPGTIISDRPPPNV